MPSPNFRAGGNINPYSFVTMNTAADNEVIQASAATAVLIGITTPSMKLAPTTYNAATTLAAASGDPITIFGLGEICNLQAGSASTITRGDSVTSDAFGFGITATSGQQVGAIALESIAANAIGRVQVVVGVKV